MINTISASQIYGGYARDLEMEDDAGMTEEAGGSPSSMKEKTPALVYVVFVLLLVSIRFLYEYAK